jgi:hypothetical protein
MMRLRNTAMYLFSNKIKNPALLAGSGLLDKKTWLCDGVKCRLYDLVFFYRKESASDAQESVHREPGDSGDLDVRDLHPAHPLAVPLRGRVVPRQICLQTGPNHARFAKNVLRYLDNINA